MAFYTTIILAASILIPAGIALARVKNTDTGFLPFFILLWVGVATEIINTIMAYTRASSVESINVYYLAAALILNWQFKRWELLKDKRTYVALQAVMTAGWLLELLVRGNLQQFFSWYMAGSAIVVLFFASRGMTHFFHLPISRLWRHATYLICIGLIIYNMYSLIVEVFYLYGLNGSRFFRLYVQNIIRYVNLIVHLLYAYAILWIPLKRNYIMGY